MASGTANASEFPGFEEYTCKTLYTNSADGVFEHLIAIGQTHGGLYDAAADRPNGTQTVLT